MYIDKVTTWISDPILDDVYEKYRNIHYSNTSHRLHKNYGPDHVAELSAKSIYWGLDGQPKIICSILKRDCWPENTFRILNRLWKPDINSNNAFSIDNGFSLLIIDQVSWCINNCAEGIFMSRQTPGRWQHWASEKLEKMSGLKFYLPTEKFLTCNDEDSESCWQKIIYYGDLKLLNSWKKKLYEN
jgi:hypothetical protein